MRFANIFGVALATALVATHAHAQSGIIQFSGAIVDPACSVAAGDMSTGAALPSSGAGHLVVNCARPAGFTAAIVDLQNGHAQQLASHGHSYGISTLPVPDKKGSQNMVVVVSYL
ncbi:type 1 fimbrial protein [Paraburkholderia sp. BCC1885]|jgi:type 1 fimbria pilin|uniref:type 1 fimbrial protein n=1 Tax=Paraburkholderia sp. BCC1885 TaxID=2562669 RepID=UPI0011837A55|nr:type 1 fimbrial protein [Paraburkholderia sp. BCC1885]